MEQVYGGFQRSPEIQTWGRGSEWNPRHQNAGKIDYAAYGGEAKHYADQRALSSLDYAKKKGYGDKYKYVGKKEYYGDAWRNRDTWGKVASHLGIDKVDSETDLRQMYDFVQGIGKEEKDDDKPEYKPTPIPEDPYTPHGDPPKGTTRPGGNTRPDGMPKPGDFGTNRPPGSIPYIPPSSDEGRAAYGTAGGGKTSLDTAIESVADYGNRATDDYFGRFLPEMGRRNTNEARATGRSLLSNIQNFTGKVPELGSPKDLFKYYLGKID
jgi:hypothetical protein